MAEFRYTADGETVRRFFASDAFVRGIRGPVGSGKTVACCIEIFRRSVTQARSPVDNLRKTRWAVIRNTQPELKTTTIKTWLDWFPEATYGRMNWSPPFTHHIRRGEIDMEVIFLALDKPEDVKKLLSLELTGAFVNEAREVPKAVIDGATMRVGRYPSERDGGPTWSGLIMDTNSPDEDHWWAIMSGDKPPPDYFTPEEVQQLVRPASWEFFRQPAAMLARKGEGGQTLGYEMNLKRENRKAIKPEYYERMVAGKTHRWISVYVGNEYGSLSDGKPVYPDFDRTVHVAREPLLPFAGVPIIVGMDFGLTPAALFGQLVAGRWYILRELVATDMGIVRFAEPLRREMTALGGDHELWGDPTGDSRAQTDERTPFMVLKQTGIMVRAATSNDPALRIEAVRAPLIRMVRGQPGLVVDPRCRNLIAGFEGGYHYARLNVSGPEKYAEKPEKNRFSHIHDACQYMMLGGGEGRLLTRGRPSRVTQAKREFDVFARKPKPVRQPVLKGW